MNARLFVIFMAALTLASANAGASANAASADYRDTIRSLIAFEHADFPNIKVQFFRPMRVNFSEKHQARTAVECLWSYTGPHGEIMLGISKDIFLVDGGLIVKVLPTDRLTWVDGPPAKNDIDLER